MKISSSRLILKDGEKAGWAIGISLSAWASAVRGQRDVALRTFLSASDAGSTNRGMADLINLGRTPWKPAHARLKLRSPLQLQQMSRLGHTWDAFVAAHQPQRMCSGPGAAAAKGSGVRAIASAAFTAGRAATLASQAIVRGAVRSFTSSGVTLGR